MATGAQVETLTKQLAIGSPVAGRAAVKNGLVQLGGGIASLTADKALLDTVVADAATAGQDAYDLAQIQADWHANLVATVSGWTYMGKTGLNALAQVIKDLSVQSGLEGGANRTRLFKGAPGSEVIIAVT